MARKEMLGPVALLAAIVLGIVLAAGKSGPAAPRTAPGAVVAVGAENEYANVISQIGGPYVQVTAVLSNPNTDPLAFEASPAVARTVAAARLVVQNGLQYDAFMTTIEAASPSSTRRVVDVQALLHLPDSTPNPHLWYAPSTMPRVAAAVASDLSAIEPAHRRAFARNLAAFDRSLERWRAAIAALRHRFAGSAVATTEPVADDLLQAAGLVNETPFTFQRAIMNGVDPSPQGVATEQSLLAGHVKVFVYNEQVTDTVTGSLLAVARAHHIPVVGVYETMPAGQDYQSWMLAEVHALAAALAQGTSTPRS